MTNTTAEILNASAKLDALYKRINETVRLRDRSAEERERWIRACEEYHRSYPSLFYPGGDEALNALRVDDATAIKTAIDFLDADPQHHRSGYTKEEVWRRLKNASLDVDDKARLEVISLRYLERKIGREFWYMARVMSYLAPENFWKRLNSELVTAEEPKKTRMRYLLAYENGATAGGEFRRTLARERMMARYRERQSRI